MAMIPNNVIDKVRSQAKIQDIVGQYVHLSQSGKNLFAHCPFHEDRTPSFCVSPQKQIFHCFSCGRGGNVFQFLMDIKGLSFPKAVIAVAKHEGINISGRYLQNRPRRPVNKFNQTLIQIYNKAAQLYHHILIDTQAGQPALDYLHRRGLTDDTINAYNLGYAPKQALLRTLFSGYDVKTMRRSGLFNEGNTGELRDRFYNRVMYPIRNQNGQTIAFSGRVLNKKVSPAKYVNSPETPIFHKRQVLFNLDKIRPTVRKTHTVILFEGYMDVMSAYQSGVKNGIASMGTSLTGDQIKQMEAISQKVLVCYDGDTPGQRAINRAVKILMPTRLQLGVIQMPNGIDPDEYRQKYGEDQFKHYVHSAQETPTAFRLRFLKRGRNLDNSHDQLAYLRSALKAVAQVNSSVSRDVYLNGLSKEFHVDKNDLRRQITQIIQYYQRSNQFRPNQQSSSLGRSSQSQTTTIPKPKTQVEIAEQVLLNRMLNNHNVWLIVTSTQGFTFTDSKYQTLFAIAEAYFKERDHYDPDDFAQFAQRADLGALVDQINSLNLPDQIDNSEIRDCVKIIMDKAPLSHQIKLKQQALNDAAQRGDTKEEQRLTTDIIKLSRKNRGLQNG